MNDEIRDHCSRRVSPGITFLLGLFLMIFLSSLATAPANAASLSGYASCPRLHLKSSGSCVRRLQSQLDDDHISPQLRVDGIFGAQTSQAVKNFQRQMGLRPDGVVGPQTFRALEEPTEAAGIPTPSTSGVSPILHSVGNFCGALWRRTSLPVIAICVIIIVMFGAAALFGVRSVRITYGRRRLECDVERFPPQRIVDTQADVLNRYIDAQSRYPDQLPPPGDHIRSIERGSW
jgi:hypothetical protein